MNRCAIINSDSVNSDQEFPPLPVKPRLRGWKYDPSAKLLGGMSPKKKMTKEEIADAAAVMRKEKANTSTHKAESKRDRESPDISPFKSPAAKKKIAQDDMVADNAEVTFSSVPTPDTVVLCAVATSPHNIV